MSSILITGGKGFIGSHLIDTLLQDNKKIISFDRSENKIDYEGWKRVRQLQGDILDTATVNDLISKVDYVFHLAGILGTSETFDRIPQAIDLNIKGTLNILEAIKKYKKEGLIITIGGIEWLNPYSITKLTAEKLSLMYAQEFNLNINVVRGLNTYGSRQKYKPVKKAVPNFIINALQNKPLEIYGQGDQIVDLVYVKDLVKVMLKVMGFGQRINHVVDAGTGVKTTVNDLVKIIIRLTNSNSKLKYLPMRKGEPEHSVTVGDVNTLKEIGYIPSTTLEEGLRETIPWYRDHLD